MKRLFVGIPVSEKVKEKIKPLLSQLKRTEADLNLVSLENLHFTLKFLGEVKEEKIPKIKEKLAELALKKRKFSLNLKKVGTFPPLGRIKVIWIGAEDFEFRYLMKEINLKLDYLRKNEQEEVAHLTIARVKSDRNKTKLQKIILKAQNEQFGKMMVDNFALYESELTSIGPVYKEFGKFGLQ